mgnify:CR=1 FL=1
MEECTLVADAPLLLELAENAGIGGKIAHRGDAGDLRKLVLGGLAEGNEIKDYRYKGPRVVA